MIEKKSSFDIRISLKICYVSLKIYSFGGFDEIREECGWFQDSRSGISLISTLISKMPVHCTEHQDAFFYKTPIVIDPCRSNPMCKN